MNIPFPDYHACHNGIDGDRVFRHKDAFGEVIIKCLPYLFTVSLSSIKYAEQPIPNNNPRFIPDLRMLVYIYNRLIQDFAMQYTGVGIEITEPYCPIVIFQGTRIRYKDMVSQQRHVNQVLGLCYNFGYITSDTIPIFIYYIFPHLNFCI